jgi:pheromone alpha factor receptor
MATPTSLTIPIPSPESFDPTTQLLTMFANYGNTIEPISVSMEDLTTFWYQNMHLGLVYGSQLGLASLMLITILLLTQPGKRRAPIYILNVSALVLDLSRSALMAYWLTGMWNHPVVQFLGQYELVGRGDYVASVMVNVVRTLEVIVILWSLILQVRVILCTVTPFQRAAVLSMAFIMATITVSVQLAVTVVNSRNILLLVPVEELGLQQRLADLSRILQMVSTCFFLLVFVAKLGVAIRQRKKMGCAKFGPMQIVFIGSLQSMLLPGMLPSSFPNQYHANPSHSNLHSSPMEGQRRFWQPLLNHPRYPTPTNRALGQHIPRGTHPLLRPATHS